MSEPSSVYIEEIILRDKTINVDRARFLRNENALWLVHVDINEAVHALVYPSEPTQQAKFIRLKLAARFFRNMSEFQQTLDKVFEDVFGEKGEVENNYVVDVTAPINVSPYTKNGERMSHQEELAKFQQMNHLESQAVAMPVIDLLSRLTPAKK